MTSAPEHATGYLGDVTDVTRRLRTWQEARSAHAQTLTEADNSDKLPALLAELAELEAKERLAHDLQLFTEWQQVLRTITKLNTAHSALATNKINFAQRTLIEGGLAKELDAALSEEVGVGKRSGLGDPRQLGPLLSTHRQRRRRHRWHTSDCRAISQTDHWALTSRRLRRPLWAPEAD